MSDAEFDFTHTDKKEARALSLHPAIWMRLGELAKRHYEGSRSAAVEGLTLHEWMVEAHRLSKGEGLNTHWISAPLVLRPGEMQPVLTRLLQGDVDYVGSYFDAKVESRASAEIAALKAKITELTEELARERARRRE